MEEQQEQIDFQELVERTKRLTGFTAEHEFILTQVRDEMRPHLPTVTEAFYKVLGEIPKAQPFLSGRVEVLKKTHLMWLDSLFTGPFDEAFARQMYQVGMVHVKVKLPVEFMQGAATLIISELTSEIAAICGDNAERQAQIIASINGVIGFSVAIMQESYQASSLVEELEKFLAITGMSRVLFNNLALAYK
ncbi:protoglobin domain-containing protein [Pseudomonadota bacterium]